MKKVILITTLIYLFCPSLFAQFSGKQIISENDVQFPRFIKSVDINNDSHLDILMCSFDDLSVIYNNGNGTFEAPTILATNLGSTRTIDAADIDGDADIDIVSLSASTNDVFWIENLNDGTFSDVQLISNNGERPFFVKMADIDGDNDADLLCNYKLAGKMMLFKNDGTGQFDSGEQLLSGIGGSTIETTDFNGDGFLDIATPGNPPNHQLGWIRGLDGAGNFSSFNVIQQEALAVESIFVADFNGDTTMDILKGAVGEKVAWHSNTDGQGNFADELTIDDSSNSIFSVHAADLDNDGDMDAIATNDNTLSWWENIDGLGTFGPKQDFATDFNFPRSVIAADIDNDGDQDVIVASQNDHTIAWFENLTILSTPEAVLKRIKFYPNPVGNALLIKPNTTQNYSIEIRNTLGQIVVEKTNNPTKIDVSKIAPGILFVTIQQDDAQLTTKIIKE